MIDRARRCAARCRTVAGFTLVEMIVVLAVVLLLTGIAVPMITGYVNDGRRARAEAEVKLVASAVTSFYKDLGGWPARNSAGVDNQLYVLCSGPALPSGNPFTRSHRFTNWLLDGTHGDTLDNHLLQNTPGGASAAAYATTGSVRWRGPYTAGGLPLDPWGHPYLVTVISGFSANANNYKRLLVISAGPDGAFQTVGNLTATTDLAGDDIGIIVSQRP